MDNKQKQACVDYINEHAAELHRIPKKDLDIGGKITIEQIVKAEIVGINAVVLVDRGVKGTPKYVIPLADLEDGKKKLTL